MRFFLYFLFILAPLHLFSGAESIILGDDITSIIQPAEKQQKAEMPDPSNLKLNWWEYFEINDAQELAQRMTTMNQYLYSLLPRLNGQEHEKATALINNTIMHLNALLSAKQQAPMVSPIPQPFLNSYTIEQQIELNHKIQLASIEKKNEQEDLEHLKERVTKLKKHLDNLMVPYLSKTKSSIDKMLAGLEIMDAKASLASSQELVKQSTKRFEIQKTKVSLLEAELNAAKELLNVKQFNVNQLEAEIVNAQKDLDKKQADVIKLENNAYNSPNNSASDRDNRHLHSQKLVHAAARRSLAWTKLAFYNLKYNLYMHVNKHFNESNKEMSEKLKDWKEQLDKITHQASIWKKSALREQDRVRHDYASLIAQQEGNDSNLIRLNQARRQESLETLSTLQHLEDEVFNAHWLIDLLENHIRSNSSFAEVTWMNITASLSNLWSSIDSALNYSLFTIGELPITLMSIFRIVFIITISFFLSKLIRSTLIGLGGRRNQMTASTLYTLARLAHYLTLIFGAIIALMSIGFDFSNLMLLASALTLGIGFGLQSFANNFICGLRILFERNIKIGDYIELQSGTYGKVTEIHVQNTVICTSDGIEIVVPNSELANHTLINYTMNNDYRRLNITFSVASDADKNLVRKIVSEAAQHVPCAAPIAKHGFPQVWLKKFDKYSLEFCLAVWVNYKAKSFSDSREADFLWEIESTLKAHKIPLTSSSPTILLTSGTQLIELPIEGLINPS